MKTETHSLTSGIRASEPFELGPDGIYRCQAFHRFAWLQHGFGTRQNNPAVEITLRQIHSNLVLNGAGMKDREREGDALITNRIGLSIGVRTADCVPILLVDAKRRAVAAVHAGWRGTAAQIAKHAIERLSAEFSSDPADLYAAIGPCIRACCYEVGPDVAQNFGALFQTHASAPGKSRLDLAAANRTELTAAGLAPARIFDCDLCTACHIDRFFSYRREPQNPGRMLSAIQRLA